MISFLIISGVWVTIVGVNVLLGPYSGSEIIGVGLLVSGLSALVSGVWLLVRNQGHQNTDFVL